MKTYRKGELTLLVPERRPRGHEVEPTDIVIDRKGIVHVPIWRPKDRMWSVMQLDHMVVDTLPAAIRQCGHVLSGYEAEHNDLRQVVDITRKVYGVYLTLDQASFEDKRDALKDGVNEAFGVLVYARRPEKQRARNQLAAVGQSDGRDRLGRFNPQAQAWRLLSALYQIEHHRFRSIQCIVASIAGREEALKFVRRENLYVINGFANWLHGWLKNPWFNRSNRLPQIWYSRKVTELRQQACELERLWGRPYSLVRPVVLKQVNQAVREFRERHQLIAAKLLRELATSISRPPQLAARFTRQLVNLRRSKTWAEGQRGPIEARLRAIIEGLSNVQDPIFEPVGLTVREGLEACLESLRLTGSSFEDSSQLLDRAITRCEW